MYDVLPAKGDAWTPAGNARSVFRKARLRAIVAKVLHKTKLAFALASAWFLLAGTYAQASSQQSVVLKYAVDPRLASCPDVVAFRAMMAERLGYDPCHEGSALGVEIRARPAEQGIDGILHWSTPGEGRVADRHFSSRGQDCHELMATIAFAVAVQLELMATRAAAEVPPSWPPAADIDAHAVTEQTIPEVSRLPAATSTSATTPPVPISNGQNVSAWSAMSGAGPAVGTGLAPDAIFSGRLFLSAGLGRARLELGAEASLPATSYQYNGGGFRHQLTLGTLAACAAPSSLQVCGLAKLGVLRVHGVGIDNPASPSGPVALVGPRIAYVLGLGRRLMLLAHVDGLYSLKTWSVDVNHTVMWTMPRFAVVAGIDLGIRFSLATGPDARQ